MTPFVGDQYVGLVQQSVAAAVVNDGRVGGDLLLRDERRLDFTTGAGRPVFTEVHLHGHVSGGSVLQGVNSSVLGNDTLDVSLERRHESEELSDELDLLSGVLEPLHSGLFHLAILHWDFQYLTSGAVSFSSKVAGACSMLVSFTNSRGLMLKRKRDTACIIRALQEAQTQLFL